MMKHTALRFTIAALLLLLVACHKEGSGRVELVLEPLSNANVKLAVVNDIDAVWCDGDEINFNGSVVAITREDETHAYISNVYSQSVNSACFPANLATTDLGGNTVGVLLPSAYHYRRDGSGRQLVELPMVARAADGDPLQFRHLTAALCITLSNDRTDSKTLVIDSLTVSSNNYLLCGPRSADMTGAEPLGAQALGEGTSSVTLFFDRERLELAPGDSRKVMVPVAPVGDGNHFTISVATRCQGTRYNYSRTQTTGGALPRNMLAYASMTLNNTPVNTRAVFEGEGSLGYPFLIKNTVDLIALTELCDGTTRPYYPTSITFSGSCYKITNDINMAGISVSPIASYTGNTFDGNNKTISNLTIVGNDRYCGLFKTVSTRTIKNLTFSNVTLISTTNLPTQQLCIGALCGEIQGTTISNCNIDGMTVEVSNAANVYMGGIAGHSTGAISLTDCSVSYSQSLTISTNSLEYGGLLGYVEATKGTEPTMTRCSVTNTSLSLSSTNGMIEAGGIIGYSTTGQPTMVNCSWTGELSLNSGTGNMYAGGLVGRLIKGTSGKLLPTNCTVGAAGSSISATSSSATKYLGAYMGFNNGTVPSFSNCTRNVTLTLNGDPVTGDIGS